MNVESLLFIFLKAVPWSVQSCAPSPSSAESSQLLIYMCPPQHSAHCWRLTCTIYWRVWVLAIRVCVECWRCCSLASCGCPQVRHPIGSYGGLLQEPASQLLWYMACCCDPYTVAVSTHPFSLLLHVSRLPIHSVFWVGEDKSGPRGQCLTRLGKPGSLHHFHFLLLEKSQATLEKGVMWVKRNCCSYPLQCIYSQMFLLQKGTGTFLLDS